MRRRWTGVVGLLMLAGCAGPSGVGMVAYGPLHPGASLLDLAQAETACQQAAKDAKTFEACMVSRGWPYSPTHWYRAGGNPGAFRADYQYCVTAPGIMPRAELSPLTAMGVRLHQCLVSRGWELRAGLPN